ncbi:dihydropteroate synthase [uncultured Alistipes sp.]|jgi:dihydropteroate synthase|uniref:dihydropteroate synthase n=2 Tax=uncultured Alistipes sp. TaxID=538949 RepID=UPI00351CDA19
MRIDFSQPCVMAILNATPDSFFAGSRTADEAAIERRVRECLDQGADLIDVGGYSSRPGADAVAPDEEWRRVSTALGVVRRLAPHMPVSVDTFRASVAAQAAERFGEVIINDISAGELDPAMPATAARLGVPYIIMHMKGDPQTMQTLTDYRSDIVTEVCGYFGRRVAELTAAGIRRGNIVLDPGFGFAKTLEQNYELLAGLHKLCALGFPVLAGMSRKSMIYRALDASPADALAGTVALGWEALRQGATVLRVHDVREAADTVRLFGLYEQNRKQA